MNNRLHKRHELQRTDGEKFVYDLTTRMKYHLQHEDAENLEDHDATIKNLSVNGLCFVADEQFNIGDPIFIDAIITDDEDVVMTGTVAWCMPFPIDETPTKYFSTGVELQEIEGKKVVDTIYYDEEYHVEWSDVLEKIFGRYREIIFDKVQNKND